MTVQIVALRQVLLHGIGVQRFSRTYIEQYICMDKGGQKVKYLGITLEFIKK